MLKKLISFCLCAVLLLSAVSCAPGNKKKFNKSADEYFKSFEQYQTAGKLKKTVEYSKAGCYAYSYPKTGADELDAELLSYCETVTDAFLQKATSDADTLLIGYKSYSPAKDVFGVSLHCRMTVGDNTTDSVENFNRGIEITDGFKRLVTIEARDTLENIDKKDLNSYLLESDGVSVYYTTEEGEKSAKVAYTKLRAFLPDSLKETLPEKTGREIDPDKKMVALTFDDGPHNTYTNEILDTLEKYNSVATFFEVGNLVSQGAETLKRADKMGCEIASHTWSHGNLQTLSESAIKSQIDKADAAFEEVLGKKPKLLRPPYGAVGKTLRNTTDKYLIGWSVDTNDWKYRDKDKIVNTIKKAGDLDGDVVLMHSLYKSTAEAVEEIVPWLVDNGYQIVTVSELVKYKYEDSLEEGKYYAYEYFDYEQDND